MIHLYNYSVWFSLIHSISPIYMSFSFLNICLSPFMYLPIFIYIFLPPTKPLVRQHSYPTSRILKRSTFEILSIIFSPQIVKNILICWDLMLKLKWVKKYVNKIYKIRSLDDRSELDLINTRLFFLNVYLINSRKKHNRVELSNFKI